MQSLTKQIDRVVPDITALRHELHAHPELSYQEVETSRRVHERLRAIAGLHIRANLAGGTGIVATLNAGKAGPCVALRADMDALPIQEETGRPYASQSPGKMHACGHDGHTACLVGAAGVLSTIAESLPGPVKFIFQPAEEGGAGGERMCREGALDDPKVGAIFALHGWPSLPLGRIGIRSGAVLASTNPWSLTVHGSGAHAAYPHKGIDPIVVACQIVLGWQTVVSRFTAPVDACVVTVGKFHAGTAENIIPPVAELGGTIRTLNPETRERAVRLVRQIAEQTAAAFGARAELEIRDGYPVLMNDASAAALVEQTGRALLGEAAVETGEPPSLGGEDFAYYAQRVPAAFWRLGVRDPAVAEMPGLHHPRYDFNDAALPIGIAMHCAVVQEFFARGGRLPAGPAAARG
ncbi:MAG: M20 family metallopeptidase [Phycisphaerae bacterium]